MDAVIDDVIRNIRNHKSHEIYRQQISRLISFLHDANTHTNGSALVCINQEDLVKIILNSKDLLKLLIRLSLASESAVYRNIQDLDRTIKTSHNNLALFSTEDVTSIFLLLREEISYQASCFKIEQPYEYFITNPLSEGSNTCPLIKFTNVHDISCRLPLGLHGAILSQLINLASSSDPTSVIFPGDKKGYIQLSSIPLSCTVGYTFTSWIKLQSVKHETKGFVLFRIRSPTGGIDVILSDKSQDGQYQVIIRSFREVTPGTSTIFKEEIQGIVYIPASKWHLVAVKHSKAGVLKNGVISFLVDGILEWEHELSYPFLTPTDSQWIIGLGFHGQISSFAVYSDAVDAQLLKLQYEQGYYCKTLHTGIRFPQSSFDTGYTTLGSLNVKGQLAHKLIKYNLIYSIDTSYFVASGDLGKESADVLDSLYVDDYNRGLPPVKSSFLNVDKIEMTPISESSSVPVIPLLSGDCYLNLQESILDYFLSNSGTTSILYLLWGYCCLLSQSSATDNSESNESNASKALTENQLYFYAVDCIKSVFRLLKVVLSISGEIREQFLQDHGFHIIASCLSRIYLKSKLLDEDIVNLCIDIVESFGLDSKRGDGICSALQGLLFDFRVWSSCNLLVKIILTNAISNFVKNGGDLMFKYVGVQRTVDFLRLHIMTGGLSSDIGNISYENAQDLLTSSRNVHATESEANKRMECIDAGFRLLLIVVESAKIHYQKTKSSAFQAIVDILLNCLDESTNELFSERILRVLYQMHSYASQSLLRSLTEARYIDTTVVNLLSKPQFTLETRKTALELLFWYITEDNKAVPPALISVRRALHANKANDEITSINTSNTKSKPENKKILELSIQYAETSLPLKRVWAALNMLAIFVNESFDNGAWESSESNDIIHLGSSPSLAVTIPTKNKKTSKLTENVDYVLDFLSFESASGSGIAPWLVLPLLPSFLSRSSLLTCQRVLMSLNVSLKTDETQVEVICSFPDREWMSYITSLAILSEKLSPAISSYGFEMVYQEQCQQDDHRVAATCIELALDTLATIMERKMRYSGMNAKITWSNLQACFSHESSNLQLTPDTTSSLDMRYLKRCIALVFQRIAKSTEPWSKGLLEAIIIMFTMVYSKRLCNNSVLKVIETRINRSTRKLPVTFDEDLIDLESVSPAPTQDDKLIKATQTEEESQILCFTVDILVSLRKFYSAVGFNKRELKVMKLGLAIILGSLKVVSATGADRLARDIIAQIKFMCDPNVMIFSEVFNDFIVMTFTQLHESIFDHALPEALRDRYCALVHNILHFFQELKLPPPSTKNSTTGNTGYVYRMKESLRHIDANFDITTLLSEIELALPVAGSSFTALFDESVIENQDGYVSVTSPSQIEGGHSKKDLLDDTGSLAFSLGDDIISDTIESSNPPRDQGEAQPNSAIWWKVRHGILLDRIDTERARLVDDLRSYFINILATDKFWRKNRRHLEAEIFYDRHVCHWKLGISHESQCPARKRLVLRPSYDIFTRETARQKSLESDPSNDTNNNGSSALTSNKRKGVTNRIGDKNLMDSNELSKSLAKAFAGVIKDVTSKSVDEDLDEGTDNIGDSTHANNPSANVAPGQGWGIVDADGSEEGYGIVGVIGVSADDQEAALESAQLPTTSSHDKSNTFIHKETDDMMGDVRLVESAINQSRRVETGPCLSGTRRILHGPPKYSSRVILITASGNIWGTMAFNDKEVYFVSSLEPEDGHKDDNIAVNLSLRLRMRRRRWSLVTVSAIYLRRYRHRDTAIEVFFKRGKHRSFYIDFGIQKEAQKNRDAFAKNLFNVTPSNAFKQYASYPIHRLVAAHQGLQEKWMNHEISNFDYLMMLNTIAGRSYHDLCQYPVMPWILSQYSQSTIDLNDPTNYRDLSKPMGAINETRLNEFLSRYESFHENIRETEIPPFMYGSHYSTMVGVVLHYLVRLEPFASLHKEMQAGHFDVTDRLFASIPRTWNHNTTQLSEVKELTPEWFSLPNMFRNLNRYNLGITQDGQAIDDVELPPWASTPEEFIKIQSLALESDYVSQHLHEWIDLIFGYKQQGPDAVEANNVFYYLTYYGTVNRDMIEDESLRQAIELQIAHFGQMPYQLFRQPHPQRLPLKMSKSVIPRPLSRCFNRNLTFSLKLIDDNRSITQPTPSQKYFVSSENFEEKLICQSYPIQLAKQSISQQKHVSISVQVNNDRILLILSNGVVEVYKFGATDAAKLMITSQAAKVSKGRSQTQAAKRSSAKLNPDENPSSVSLIDTVDESMAATSSHNPVNDTSNTSTVISFDDDMMLAVHLENKGNIGPSTPSIATTSAATATLTNTSRDIDEVVIYLTKDVTHFDIVPRVVLANSPNYFKTLNSLGAEASSMISYSSSLFQPQIRLVTNHLLKFTISNKFLLSTGFVDGRISVWELDSVTGFVQSSGDYLQHRCRVVCVATDAIPTTNTDVIASLDQSGVILIWAVAKVRLPGSIEGSSILFRHPQRRFRCWKSNAMFLDISCNIGIVVCLSKDIVSVYSIERDELLNSFVLSSSESLDINNQGTKQEILPKNVALSDDGYITVNFRVTEDANDSQSQDKAEEWMEFIATFTITGYRCHYLKCRSEVTFFNCPRHGDILVTGYHDGSVILYHISDLSVAFVMDVHKGAVLAADPAQQGEVNSSATGLSSSPNTANYMEANIQSGQSTTRKLITTSPSAIVNVTLGPDPLKPAIICITTLAGDVYVRPLIDFFKWERNRSPSVLSQLVTGQIQVMKGTIQQAQNFLSSTTESATVIAQNARQYADEAIGELKKINRAAIWKGVGNLFGMGKESKDP